MDGPPPSPESRRARLARPRAEAVSAQNLPLESLYGPKQLYKCILIGLSNMNLTPVFSVSGTCHMSL